MARGARSRYGIPRGQGNASKPGPVRRLSTINAQQNRRWSSPNMDSEPMPHVIRVTGRSTNLGKSS